MSRPVSLSLLVFLLAAAAAWGDISHPAAVPPQVEAVTARVPRGGEVAIELRGHYGGPGTVVFGIARGPRHGNLSRLQTTGGNRAVVTYTHFAGHPETTDDFAYVIRAGGRISSPAEVRITIDEPPAKLATLSELDFGEIVAGGNAVRELPITNAGGGVLQGKITASHPWKIAPAEFRVEAGGTETIRIAFQPDEAKAFVGVATLTGKNGGTTDVSLRGIAGPALQVAPTTVLFGAAPRREMIALTNLTASLVSLKFETGSSLQPMEEIALEAGETTAAAVAVRPEITGPIHATLTVAGPRFTVPVAIEIAALPRAVAVASPTPAPLASPPVEPVSAAPATNPAPTSAQSPVAVSDSPVPFVKVTARRIATSLWELKWPTRKERPASYRIEELSLALDRAGNLQTNWRPVTETKITDTVDPVIAQVSGVNDRHAHVLRVTALDADGTTLWESPPVALAAAPVAARGRAFWLTGLLLALVVFVFLRWRERSPA